MWKCGAPEVPISALFIFLFLFNHECHIGEFASTLYGSNTHSQPVPHRMSAILPAALYIIRLLSGLRDKSRRVAALRTLSV